MPAGFGGAAAGLDGAAVAGTPAGRAALPSLLENAARRERIEILVAAARGYLEGED